MVFFFSSRRLLRWRFSPIGSTAAARNPEGPRTCRLRWKSTAVFLVARLMPVRVPRAMPIRAVSPGTRDSARRRPGSRYLARFVAAAVPCLANCCLRIATNRWRCSGVMRFTDLSSRLRSFGDIRPIISAIRFCSCGVNAVPGVAGVAGVAVVVLFLTGGTFVNPGRPMESCAGIRAYADDTRSRPAAAGGTTPATKAIDATAIPRIGPQATPAHGTRVLAEAMAMHPQIAAQ
jgi:hypothetical protein